MRVCHLQLAQIPFEWHHHPEYELTLTMNSRDRRFVGDHSADYSGDDLVLVSPDMPHTWSSVEPIDPREPQLAIVIWFSGDWARRLAAQTGQRVQIPGGSGRICSGAKLSAVGV
nr:AraC family ligand binding domain-containing protein [Paraburkholderia lacunae]